MSRSILFTESNIEKYQFFQTPEGNWRSKIKGKTYHKKTCPTCQVVYFGTKDQIYCGPSHSTASASTQEKYKQTMKKTHGVEYNFQAPKILEKAQKAREKEIPPDDGAKDILKYSLDDFPEK
jgi:uncharacterized Zn finger protein (UPF0148 family)